MRGEGGGALSNAGDDGLRWSGSNQREMGEVAVLRDGSDLTIRGSEKEFNRYKSISGNQRNCTCKSSATRCLDAAQPTLSHTR
jgi:hypothetical protein